MAVRFFVGRNPRAFGLAVEKALLRASRDTLVVLFLQRARIPSRGRPIVPAHLNHLMEQHAGMLLCNAMREARGANTTSNAKVTSFYDTAYIYSEVIRDIVLPKIIYHSSTNTLKLFFCRSVRDIAVITFHISTYLVAVMNMDCEIFRSSGIFSRISPTTTEGVIRKSGMPGRRKSLYSTLIFL